MKPNPVVWFEIYVEDLQRAKTFYESVFQCQLENLPPPKEASQGLQMVAFPGDMTSMGASGALVQMQGAPTGIGGTTVYFSCEDCAVEQGRVEAAGGQVFKPKFSIGEYGFCALVKDTQGNIIGLHSMQ